MTDEKYKEEMQKIVLQYLINKHRLNVQYIQENNKYKVGDIISHRGITIRIDRINYSMWGKILPYPVFKGVLIKKDGTPYKNGDTEGITGMEFLWKKEEEPSDSQ